MIICLGVFSVKVLGLKFVAQNLSNFSYVGIPSISSQNLWHVGVNFTTISKAAFTQCTFARKKYVQTQTVNKEKLFITLSYGKAVKLYLKSCFIIPQCFGLSLMSELIIDSKAFLNNYSENPHWTQLTMSSVCF